MLRIKILWLEKIMGLYKPYEQLPAAKAKAENLDFTNPRLIDLQLSMPRDNGYVKAVKYVPKERQQKYWEAWREWLKLHDKSDWPAWVSEEIDRRKREGIKEKPESPAPPLTLD